MDRSYFRVLIFVCCVMSATAAAGQQQWVAGPIHRAWTYWIPGGAEVVAVTDGKVYCVTSDIAAAVDLDTGKQIWIAERGDIAAPKIPDTAPGHLSKPVGVTRFGSEISGTPVYIDKQMICEDGPRIICYEPGPESPIPTNPDLRKERAKMLAKKFKDLDVAGEKRLLVLGAEGASTLIDVLVEIAGRLNDADYDKLSFEDQIQYRIDDRLSFRGPDLLEEMCTEAHSELLRAGGAKIKFRGWVGSRFAAIERRVNPTLASVNNLAGLIRKLIAEELPPYNNHIFFTENVMPKPPVRDPSKNKAIETVYDLLLASRALRPRSIYWEDQMSLGLHHAKQLAAGRDKEGRNWQLYESFALGSSDLFLREDNGRYHFLDVRSKEDFLTGKPGMYDGQSVASLIAGDWLDVFTRKRDIYLDSDGDGLTDLVEDRILTDKLARDSDGDGKEDKSDPMPLTVPSTKELTEYQKIIAAIISDLRIGEKGTTPAIVSADGVKPFEIDSYPGVLLWSERDDLRSTRLMSLSFGPSRIAYRGDFGGKGMFLSPSGKRARVGFYAWSGPLSATDFEVVLEKLGDDWFVVEVMIMGQS